jgi:hypothetical protein
MSDVFASRCEYRTSRTSLPMRAIARTDCSPPFSSSEMRSAETMRSTPRRSRAR